MSERRPEVLEGAHQSRMEAQSRPLPAVRRTAPSALGHIGWRQARAQVEDPETRAQDREQVGKDDALVARLVYSIVALYSVTFAILSVLQHEAFQTHAFDLGNMDQAVWNTVQGRPLEFTNWPGGNTRLAAHVEPILFLVALAYKVYSSPATLLVIQSLTIGLGALPAFWLARRALESSLAGAVFSFTYLLTPALEIANLADFHAVAMASAFLLFALYYLHVRAYPAFLVFAVLAMATKEHVPLTVFGMGLFVAYLQGHRRIGFATCFLAALWAVIAFGFVIPHFNPDRVSPYLSRYDQLGASPLEMLWRLVSDPAGAWVMLTQPAKLEFLRQLFQPTLFLSLLSPFAAALALPDLAINLLSNSPDMYSGRAHYGAVLVPIVTASAILGAGRLYGVVAALHPGSRVTARWILAVSVLVASLVGFYDVVLLPLADHPPSLTEHHQKTRGVLTGLPPEAPVSTSSTLNPHLSQRRGLYLFPEIAKAGYIAIDVTATPYPIDAANQWWRLQGLLNSGEWGVVAADDGVLLLQKGAGPADPPARFYSFTTAREQDIRAKLNVNFGPGLTLAGYTLKPGTRLHGPVPYASLDLFWRVDQTPQQDFLVEVTLVAPGAATVFFTDRHQATTLWRPPTRWVPGTPIKVHVPRLPLEEADEAEIRVALVEREPPHRRIEGPVTLTTIARD